MWKSHEPLCNYRNATTLEQIETIHYQLRGGYGEQVFVTIYIPISNKLAIEKVICVSRIQHSFLFI